MFLLDGELPGFETISIFFLLSLLFFPPVWNTSNVTDDTLYLHSHTIYDAAKAIAFLQNTKLEEYFMLMRHITFSQWKLRREKAQSDLKGISTFPTHNSCTIDCEFPLTALP